MLTLLMGSPRKSQPFSCSCDVLYRFLRRGSASSLTAEPAHVATSKSPAAGAWLALAWRQALTLSCGFVGLAAMSQPRCPAGSTRAMLKERIKVESASNAPSASMPCAEVCYAQEERGCEFFLCSGALSMQGYTVCSRRSDASVPLKQAPGLFSLKSFFRHRVRFKKKDNNSRGLCSVWLFCDATNAYGITRSRPSPEVKRYVLPRTSGSVFWGTYDHPVMASHTIHAYKLIATRLLQP